MPGIRARARCRILLAKPGLDGHDRGIKIIARSLRDAGHEVVYAGLRQTPEAIVATAVQEDVDAIGLSVLSGAHLTLFGRVLDLMREQGLDDVVLFGGGVIPDDDVAQLRDMGVAAVFTPGTPIDEILDWVDQRVPAAARAPVGPQTS